MDGDFYPLSPYGLDEDVWMVWRFNMPEKGEGVIQAFCRTESKYESMRVKLTGFAPAAVCTLTDIDVPGAKDMTGRELQKDGLWLVIEKQPGAAIITYKKNAGET